MKRFADGAARAVRPGSALAAVVLGASAAVFASGYWLIDLFPGGGKRLLLGTVLVGMAAAAGYCVAMEFLHRALARLGLWKAVLLILASAPLALLFFFAGTSQWQLENRYFVFLLPRHEFRIEAVGATEGASISWISTSVGDVSYESADLQGWNRDGTLIVLQTPTANSVEWRASPGGRLVVVIDSPRSQGNIQLAWDGQKDVIQLAAGKTVYERAFQVPYFASRAWIIVLGLANFWVLSLLLVIGLREFPSALMPKDLPDGDSSSGSGRRREILAVAAIMSVALLLRGLNLGRLFPAVDEYYHLIAADQLVRGVPPAAVYPRGLWIVTLPVAGAISIFGHEVWAARAAGAAFNAMAIIPLYLVTRRISRPVGITACLLFATSPWIMAFGRMAREYAYYPFYFYWIILAMLTLIETFPRGFIVREHWRSVNWRKVLLLAAILSAPPVFALSIDWLSTFRTILIAYVVMGAFLLARLDWHARVNWPILGVTTLTLFYAGISWYREQLTKLLPIPRVNPIPLGYFFPNPEQQSYYGRPAIVVVLALVLAAVVVLRSRRRNTTALFFIALFSSYWAIFVLFSKSFFHTRHLLSTQLWFVVVLAMGLYWLWEGFSRAVKWKGKAAAIVVGLMMATAVLNPAQIAYAALSRDPNMTVSEDYMHDMSEVHEYLLSHAREEDALVSTVYGLYATWEGAPRFSQNDRITSQTKDEELAALVRQHPSGWVVMDDIRLDLSALSIRKIAALPQMEYIGIFGDEHVWHWGRRGP